MLVRFKFYRCGYMCDGLIESKNLDEAVEALWKEHPSLSCGLQMEALKMKID
jgi:hypothetical protein